MGEGGGVASSAASYVQGMSVYLIARVVSIDT